MQVWKYLKDTWAPEEGFLGHTINPQWLPAQHKLPLKVNHKDFVLLLNMQWHPDTKVFMAKDQ